MTTAQRVYPENRTGTRSGAAARGIAASVLTLILIGVPIYIALLFADVVPLPFYQPSPTHNGGGHRIYERADPDDPNSEWVLVETVSHDSMMANESARRFMDDYMEKEFGVRCEEGQRYVNERDWFGQPKIDTWTCK